MIRDSAVNNFKELREFILKGNWKFGWYSSKPDDAQFFNQTFLPKELPPVVSQAYAQLRPLIGTECVLLRCYANLQLYGVEGYPHYDSTEGEKTKTIVLYLVDDSWNLRLGGDTTVFNTENEATETCVAKPNRAFIFDGHKLHRANAVSRECKLPRITLMFKVGLLNVQK